MKFELSTARLLSAILHPLIIPTLGMIILFNLDTYVAYSIPTQAKRFILIIVFINTAVAPLLSIMLLKRIRMISDMLLDNRNDRLLPLLLAAIFFFLTYFMLRGTAIPSLIYFYLLGAGMLVLICMLITMRWKISIHMTSIGGLTGFLIVTSLLLKVDLILLLMVAILSSGLLGVSRIKLQAHTPAQVYAGFTLGVIGMLLLYLFLRV
ncbi:MAG: hypothetical protein R6U64_08170 [Bacteroidales bacterium]